MKLKENILENTESKSGKLSIHNFYKKYPIILDEIQFTAWISELKKASTFAFNIKTDNLNNIGAKIVGFSFAIRPGVAAYVPVAHDYLNAPKQISCEYVFKLIKPILEDEEILKIGKNLKYNCNILKNYGIELHGIAFDVGIESYILDGSTGRYNVAFLSKRWLRSKTTTYEKVIYKGKNRLKFNQISLEEAGRYALEEIDIILQLHLKMWPKLQKYERSLSIFQNIEIPLVPVLSCIECNGVKIDLSVLHKYSEDITIRLYELEQEAYNIAGEEFNLSSTKHLRTILFEKLKIKPLRKTSHGVSSTSKNVLEELALNYSLPKIILNYRELMKLKSTYIDKLSLMINQKTGRVHTSYNQTITMTGRLSSTNPNLQNIPVRNENGRRIRQAFIAPEDYSLVSADYSQIELRIMAHLSRDKVLLKAFSEGKDIHCTTAAEIFGLSSDSITHEQRRSAKAINFGLIYGMSAFGLSRQLNITLEESYKYMNLYFKRYSGVLEYIEFTKSQVKKKGYVETLDGRRLYLPDIKSNNWALRAAANRTAINAPIQGTAADIIKRAMIAIDTWLKKDQPLVRMIMQVHDELVFEVYKKDAEFIIEKIRKIMENIITKLDVPLLVEIGIGENWYQAH